MINFEATLKDANYAPAWAYVAGVTWVWSDDKPKMLTGIVTGGEEIILDFSHPLPTSGD